MLCDYLSILLVLSLLFCVAGVRTSLYGASAFCKAVDSDMIKVHPLQVPEWHIPWVWEAVHDPIQGFVDVSIVTPNACSFNQTNWMHFFYKFPQYSEFFANGKSANILVPPDCINSPRPNLGETLAILGKRVKCVFHSQGSIVKRKLSLPVQMTMPTMGPMLIRCPASLNFTFDSMSLEVTSTRSTFCRPNENSTSYSTVVFPVCKVPNYDVLRKQYKLSIVSATARVDETKMVEWIEYHRLMGVQHFFLYNTAVGVSSAEAINRMLSGYVKEGVVTVIPWHFMNCVRGMGRGRVTWYIEPLDKTKPLSRENMREYVFKPPSVIANYVGLVSAYTRFRHTSKYILYIDDDEFVSINVNSRTRNLLRLANQVFSENPTTDAIKLHPIDMNHCPDNDRRLNITLAPSILPRIGSHVYAYLGQDSRFEPKLLVRTDSVAMFSVHYVSVLDKHYQNSSWPITEYTFPIDQAALLHFKTPAHISGDPFSYGSPLPIPLNINQSNRCDYSHRIVDPYKKGLYRNANLTGHVLTARNMKKLVSNVSKRLLKQNSALKV